MKRLPPGCPGGRWQAGLTLIEIMVALAIGLFLLLGILTLYANSYASYRAQQAGARLQEEGRLALTVLEREVRQAGFADIALESINFSEIFSGTAITGSDGGAGTDTLTVSYDGDNDCTGNPVSGGTVTNTWALSGTDLICTGNGSGSTATAMFSNVGDFQVLYGVDADGDQSADQYTASPASFANVVTARLCLLLVSDQPNSSSGSQSYADCDGASVTATDGLLRRRLMTTLNLRNRVTTTP
jgi:type IV pilus assembly protein PilW